VRRFAQDDGLVGVLKNILAGVPKTREIKKVTTSQDDDFVGVSTKNIQNQVSAYGRSPVQCSSEQAKRTAAAIKRKNQAGSSNLTLTVDFRGSARA
jgi:hypothetical protein